MTAIETAWNNPTPQPTARHPGHLRARRSRGRRHPPTPPTPHLTSEDWRDKDYGEENPAPQQYPAEIGTNLTRLNANPQQNGNLWDGTDTDSKYAYPPSTTPTATPPDTATPLQYAASNPANLLRRTTADNDEDE